MIRTLVRPVQRELQRGKGVVVAKQQQHKRKMSGLVEKNYFVEEWNGRREITEKTFKFDGKTVPSLIGLALIFPGFIYFVMKDELKKKYEKLGYNVKKGGDRDMM
ncbi:hypothetical protein VYU27_001839 [Nannochloropsis oceanica]